MAFDPLAPTPAVLTGISVKIPRQVNLADWMQERLMAKIEKFQESLAPDEEVGACLTNFGREMLIHIEDIGYHNPDLVIFYGVNEGGHRVELMQHSSQVNVLLMAVKVPEGKTPRRIGFKQNPDSEE